MLPVPPDDVEAGLVSWIRDWLDLLAAARLDEACALLDGPGADGEPWTPEKVVASVNEAFHPQSPFRRQFPGGIEFTPVAAVRGGKLGVGVIPFDDGGYWIDHDMPLNGEWSDLTAQFLFERRGDEFAVLLQELHVM